MLTTTATIIIIMITITISTTMIKKIRKKAQSQRLKGKTSQTIRRKGQRQRCKGKIIQKIKIRKIFALIARLPGIKQTNVQKKRPQR